MSSRVESYNRLTNFDTILCLQYPLLILLRTVCVYIVYFNHTQTHAPPLTFPRYPQTCLLTFMFSSFLLYLKRITH